ncbi:MAG: hypothetical protein ABSE49_21585 [Polyangiaceae bacterium]|jgi:hypothetical protein
MASCLKCGATLIALARFCAACGSPVTRGSVAPVAPPPKSDIPSTQPAPDPFAQTVMGGDVNAILQKAEAAAVSPMAASFMVQDGAPPPARAAPAAYAQPQPYPSPPAPQAQYAQPVAPPAHSIPPGTLVLVYWANGQRYPGTVLQVSPNHVFVAFPNGVQQWIDARYVTVGA